MSWIFGQISKSRNPLFLELHSKSNTKIEENNFKISLGEITDNFFFSTKDKWIYSGINIDSVNKKLHNFSSISELLTNNEIDSLSGHFAIIQWDNNFLEITTDKLGLKEIYLYENSNSIFFTSDIIKLKEIVKLSLNFSEFSSRWLLFNQLSNKSIFENVQKISASSCKINLKDFKITHINHNVSINKKDLDEHSFVKELEGIVNIENSDKTISLGLSGGTDSRVLLSILVKNKIKNWNVHSFGDPKDLDCMVARKIAAKLNIEHLQLDNSQYSNKYYLELLPDYMLKTMMNNQASSVLKLNSYDKLAAKNYIVIDGGFGEIWRREFLFKLLLRGKKAIYLNDIDNILKHLVYRRADIFNNDALEIMLAGLRKQLLQLLDNLPSIRMMDVENWLDLFAVRTRLPNFYSHEQNRLDEIVTCYMPFANSYLLENLFNIPIQLRRNSNLLKYIIQENAPELTRIKRVKGDFLVPFYSSSLKSRVLGTFYKRFKNNNNNSQRLKFLLSIKKEVQDLSNLVLDNDIGVLEKKKVDFVINSFYSGDTTKLNEIDWMLSYFNFQKALIK